ncbi:MAG: short-chain dehydrogenase [Phycisphaerae bacterium]|nr:short-chain dehydrogenase [Phycisphaerae bacterium]
MTRPLEDRVAIITGASAGIGEACARAFARAGSKMILNARRAEVLSKIERSIDTEMGVETAHCVPGDCADETVIKMMLQSAADHFDKRADLIVVNAGRGLAGSVLTSDEGEWEEMIRTNIVGASKLIRIAAAELERLDGADWTQRPRDIVVIGSTVGRHISPFSSMYGATKFAVNSLAEATRRELAPKGIRVTLIEPGIVTSEFQHVAGYDPSRFGEVMDRMGPVLEPEDIADLLVYTCSRPARVCVGDVVIRGTRQDYP